MRLQTVLLGLTPFVLVALYHHLHYTTLSASPYLRLPQQRSLALRSKLEDVEHGVVAERSARMLSASSTAHPPAAKERRDRERVDSPTAASAAAASAAAASAAAGSTAAASAAAASAATPAAAAASAAAPAAAAASATEPEWGLPTLSRKRLLDGSPNWLAVADAESARPSDLAWRDAIRPGEPCPPGRRPFHVILTAQASIYQEWQTKIMYYHFKKIQAQNPCTEMTGFTRLLASRGAQLDELAKTIPTIVVEQATQQTTKGFQVINRPWSFNEMLKTEAWRERITEDYVFIAETDHLILRDIPNRATPSLSIAFFFPYMSPVPKDQAAVIHKYFDGDHLSVQPVGPSPALMHVDLLRKVVPLWLKLSVDLKHDGQADSTFGWVLEMWGYSLACARLGIKHYAWQQLQIEPSSTWHQNVSAEEPYIYHYTFGVEYSSDGVPVVGSVGDWSLDKRHYFGGYPPKDLSPPPKCAQECAWVWWRHFNEASAALGAEWKNNGKGGDTTSFGRRLSAALGETPLSLALVKSGPWAFESGAGLLIKNFFFFKAGRFTSPWGTGSWRAEGERQIVLRLCGEHRLTFDSETNPSSFTTPTSAINGMMGKHTLVKGHLMDEAQQLPASGWDVHHPAVTKVMGSGPWAWAGVTTMAFFDHGRLHTPWGPGHYAPAPGRDDALIMSFVGAKHTVTVSDCHKFHSVRDSDGAEVDGWVQLSKDTSFCQWQ